MLPSTQRWYSRGDRVRCRRTLLASHDGKAITGPAVTGAVFDDQGMAEIYVRANDGKLHAAYRGDVEPAGTAEAFDILHAEGLL